MGRPEGTGAVGRVRDLGRRACERHTGRWFDALRDVLGRGVPPRIVATTERLNLRTWASHDAGALAELMAHPDVVRYLGDPRDADVVIADYNGREDGLGVTTWAIEERSSSRLLGWCGFARPNAAWLNPAFVEIGWMLGPLYWG